MRTCLIAMSLFLVGLLLGEPVSAGQIAEVMQSGDRQTTLVIQGKNSTLVGSWVLPEKAGAHLGAGIDYISRAVVQKASRGAAKIQKHLNKFASPSAGSNITSVWQNGRGNHVSILQSGAGNAAQATQAGNNNRVSIIQCGVGHQAAVTQTGNHNNALIIQKC